MKVTLCRSVAALVFFLSVNGYAFQARVPPPPPTPHPVVEEPEPPPAKPRPVGKESDPEEEHSAAKPNGKPQKIKLNGKWVEYGTAHVSPEQFQRLQLLQNMNAAVPTTYAKVEIVGSKGYSHYQVRVGTKVVDVTDLRNLRAQMPEGTKPSFDISALTKKDQMTFKSSAKLAGIDADNIFDTPKPLMNVRGKPDPHSYVEEVEKTSTGTPAPRAAFRVDGHQYRVRAVSTVRAAVVAFFAQLKAFITSPGPKTESVYDHVQRLKHDVEKEYGTTLQVSVYDDLGRAFWVELRLIRLRDDG